MAAAYFATNASIVDDFDLELRATLQPVITSTVLLVNPIGRISDELLVLPMGSAFLRFTGPFESGE